MPMDRKKYPPNWPAISREIRARARSRCEGPPGRTLEDEDARCSARQNRPHPLTGSVVELTVAHLNHVPMDCRPENLRAMCQRCHLNYDRPRHIAKARAMRRSRRAVADLFDLRRPGLVE